MRVTLVGHATVLVDLDGVRLLTDPLLSERITFLRTPKRGEEDWTDDLGAVLLSHFHRDHLDLRSLRRLETETLVVGPPGTERRVRRAGLANVAEIGPGESVDVRGVTVRATAAAHGRLPGRFAQTALGFLVLGSSRLYFAGDTDLFPELAELAEEQLDVALLPVGGWGPRLGAGHLDAPRAAEAARLIRPRIAVPIHWGFLHPLGVGWLNPAYLRDPGPAFARLVGEVAPDVAVRVLRPGETLRVPE